MKPWEETWVPSLWRHDGQQRPMWAVEPATPDPLDGEPIFEFNDPDQEPRAKLAAAAPEMARLLLAMHDDHGDRHTFDWAYWFTEIEKVLDKAGVEYPDPSRT